MTGTEFRVWQAIMNLSGRNAAAALGKSEDTVTLYRHHGVPDRESRIVRLACAALLHDLKPFQAHNLERGRVE